MSGALHGCYELREWLNEQGFDFARDLVNRDNECNWYAFRRSALPARECETNEGKAAQIVVRPYRFTHDRVLGGVWESAEVDLIGEAGGVWFKLQAYSLRHEVLRARLGDIEASLIAAWNALLPAKG